MKKPPLEIMGRGSAFAWLVLREAIEELITLPPYTNRTPAPLGSLPFEEGDDETGTLDARLRRDVGPMSRVGPPSHPMGPPSHRAGPPSHPMGPPSHPMGPPSHRVGPPSHPMGPPSHRPPSTMREMPPRTQRHYPYVEPAPVIPAPNSLAPVAMADARDAAATGPRRAARTVELRGRASVATGVSILIAGTLMGGVIGITMRARQNAADATYLLEQQQQQLVQHAPPREAAPAFGAIVPAPSALPPAAPAQGYLGYLPPQAPVVVPSATPPVHPVKESKAKHPPVRHPSAKPSSKEKGDGYRVASADPDAKGKDSPSARRAPTRGASAKSDDAAAKSKPPEDAANVLKAAMGATENTL